MNLLIDFCPLFPCFRVGGAFRSGVQPPTGIRSDRHSATPNRLKVDRNDPYTLNVRS